MIHSIASQTIPSSIPTNTNLLTTREVADRLASKEKTIRQWVYQRKIPYLKINGLVRFDAKTIDQWIAGNSQN